MKFTFSIEMNQYFKKYGNRLFDLEVKESIAIKNVAKTILREANRFEK